MVRDEPIQKERIQVDFQKHVDKIIEDIKYTPIEKDRCIGHSQAHDCERTKTFPL